MNTEKRLWLADNGHKVAVMVLSHKDNGTIYDKINRFSRVSYRCECGRSFEVSGRPKKSHLAEHDNWITAEEAQKILEML